MSNQMFNNLSVRTKIFLVPIGMIIFLVILGSYGLLLLSTNQRELVELREGILRQSASVSALHQEALSSITGLYRTVSVAANETDAPKLAKLIGTQKDEMAHMKVTLATAEKSMSDAGLDAGKIAAIESAFDPYQKSAKMVLEMADSDVASATNFMMGAEHKFSSVLALLEDANNALEDMKNNRLDAIQADMKQGRLIFVVSIALIVVIALSLSLVISTMTTRPIIALAAAVKRISEKDYGVTIPALGQKDEVGHMADAVEVLKHQSAKADKADELKRTTEETMRRSETLMKLLSDFDANITQVITETTAAVDVVQSTSSQLVTTAENSRNQSSEAANAAEVVKHNISMVASSAEELTASVQEISQQVGKSAVTTQQAVEQSRMARDTVQNLTLSTGKISQIVNFIHAISEQTSLLALNATIEAARAGEAGKGFAVVASEVKTLASQTSKATEEISSQVSSIQEATKQTVSVIEQIGQVIGGINQTATSIAAAVEEQGSATREIARSVQQVAISISEVSSNIENVNGAAVQTESMAKNVGGSAENMSEQAKNLRQQVENFLRDVRAI